MPDSRRNAAGLQQLADVAGIAGQDEVGRRGHERYVRVGYVGGARQREQFPDPLAVVLAERLDADARQHPGEVGLPAPVAPDLADDGGAYPDRSSLLLQCPKLGTR